MIRPKTWWQLLDSVWKSYSDVLDNSGKSEGKRSHGTRDYPPGLGEYWTSIKPGAQKGHGHAAAGSTRTLGQGIKERAGLGTATHRLRTLGIASPFDLPKDPYYLLELFAIVLCRRIHFLSVKTSHYFSSNVGTPESNLQGNQDNRTVRADNEFGARDSHRNRNRNSATPLSQIEGEAPDVYIFHLRDISRTAS